MALSTRYEEPAAIALDVDARHRRLNAALTGAACLLVFAILYWTQAVLIPIASVQPANTVTAFKRRRCASASGAATAAGSSSSRINAT